MTETYKDLTFEEAMAKLEEIVEQLETGDVPLEKSITNYQQGMILAKICSDKLTNVQDKMAKIINEQGEIIDFTLKGED